jgi:tetratricopeptide (TPR) repeat protein
MKSLHYKSIKLGNSVFTKALYADALMFAGDYEKAKLAFFDYIENAESPKEEFHLKGICLESILKEYGIKKQKRKAEKATKLADLSNLKDGVNPIAQLEKALELDLLSGLAWFNLGITHNDNSEFSQACFCFTMAALVQKNDIEAWKNATLCAFNSKTELMIIPLILRTAFFFNREDFLESLYSQLEEQNKSGSINEIIEMIEKVLPEQQKADKLPTVRVLNEKGQFENIFEKVKGHNKG